MANEINGSDLFVFMGGVPVAHSTSHTLTFAMTDRPTSNKDSGIFDTTAAGRFSADASCDGLCVYTEGFTDLMDAMALRVPVTLEFGQKQGGLEVLDTTVWYASGDFIITGMVLTAGDTENATYAATFKHYANFSFTPYASLNVIEAANVPSATNASLDGMAAVYVTGGIEPYTFAWDVSFETTNPAIALDGAFVGGIAHTVTVTDSTPVTPLTGTCVITVMAVAAA